MPLPFIYCGQSNNREGEKMTEDSCLIYSFPRGKGEEIQASIRKYKGKYFIDLRLWFQSHNEHTLLPTKKGVSFSVDQAQELRKAAERLCKAVKRIEVKEDNDKLNCSNVSQA